MPPDIRYVVFCESVRSEQGGKVSLMGVWGDRCVVHSAFPVQFPGLGIHVYISDPEQVCDRVRLRALFPGGGEALEREIPIQVKPGMAGHNLNVNLTGMPIMEPGTIVLTVWVLDQAPREFRLEIANGASST